MRIQSIVLFALYLSLSAGCLPAYSPPARVLPLETARTLPKQATGVQVEGGGGGEVLGPDIFHGTVRVRHGLADRVELAGETTVLGVRGFSEDDENGEDESISLNVYSLRLGLKYGLSRHFALTAGVGTGVYDGGYFMSPDLGATVSYDNPYAVPFMSLRGFLSQPVSSTPIDTGMRDQSGQPELEDPITSYGLGWTTGVRVPVGRYFGENEQLRRFGLLAGVGGNALWARSERGAHLFSASLGLELLF